MINLPGCIVLPPGVTKIFQIRKIQRFDISDKYFRFDYGVFVEMKVVKNGILNNLYLHDKLLILHCSPSGSLQIWPNSQILLFFRPYTTLFRLDRKVFWSKWMISKKTLWTTLNLVMNSLGFIVFSPRAAEIGNIQSFCKKIVFLSTLETPREKTVYFRELVNILKVVYIVISDIIHFDQKTVRSNLKDVCKI